MPIDSEAAAERWRTLDRARAPSSRDVATLEATAALRSRVLEELARSKDGSPTPDLLHASAMLGRLLHVLGASPGFAVRTLDGAAEALGEGGPWERVREWLAAPRAALAEGYVAALTEGAAHRAAAAWDPPRCLVRSGELLTVAAGFPEDDADALHAWAGRVASFVARAGPRSVTVSGGERACAALAEAFEVAGVSYRRGDALR